MDNARLVKVSKYLSKHLRHQPKRLGLALAPGGWVEVAELLAACARSGFSISREELDEVVARNDKKRFSFDQTGVMIRANQGHSVDIDLQLAPSLPPEVLYHGTGHKNVEVILREGLRKMRRHHVHLSSDTQTALRVGMRHGRPVVFAVDTSAMQRAGFVFYLSTNGVWLVESVPPDYLREVE
ncbi:MAG: RNA 2'-phosphotransferase [Blastocatellia bacterium]|nr:RNA 2'-phosphotransferase [Blastocatellia bacterium]